MCRCSYLVLMLFIIARLPVAAQDLIIERMPFSTRLNDEFSPVLYKDGLVFCSNIRDNSLVGYSDHENNLFKIFYVEGSDSSGWKHPSLLAKELTSGYNDGPVTFNKPGNVIYFSRNNSVEKYIGNISDTTNKMGIYRARYENGTWTAVGPVSFNNPLYTFLTPSLAPEEERIFFASDMPGGFGGLDLYYSEWDNGDWGAPVNLGPSVNTHGNECFPFASEYGKLYFSSDGHGGAGGKDLFYTQDVRGSWITPVPLDSLMNSPADDFGLVLDPTFRGGYFSSRRLKSDDIFRFSSPPPDFTDCDSILENNYCFTLYDEKYHEIDTIPVTYTWDFGNGILRQGIEVRHCFPGPGRYTVRLTITDDLTGDTISEETNFSIDLDDIEQVYISSADLSLVGKSVIFDSECNLKDFVVTDYFWDFGEGFKPGGPTMSRSYEKSGDFPVRLGLVGRESDLQTVSRRCFMKKIRIFDSFRKLEPGVKTGLSEYTDPSGNERSDLGVRIFFMDDIQERQRSGIRSQINFPVDAVISFNKYGLAESSYNDLDNIISVLKANPDITLGISVQATTESVAAGEMSFSEKCEREVEYYFRQNGQDLPDLRKGTGFSPWPGKASGGSGLIEFIFMKR